MDNNTNSDARLIQMADVPVTFLLSTMTLIAARHIQTFSVITLDTHNPRINIA